MKIYFLVLCVALVGPQTIEALNKRNENAPDCSGCEDGDTFPDSSNCAQYYMCIGGNALKKCCARGLYFDAMAGLCNRAFLVDCDINRLGSKLNDILKLRPNVELEIDISNQDDDDEEEPEHVPAAVTQAPSPCITTPPCSTITTTCSTTTTTCTTPKLTTCAPTKPPPTTTCAPTKPPPTTTCAPTKPKTATTCARTKPPTTTTCAPTKPPTTTPPCTSTPPCITTKPPCTKTPSQKPPRTTPRAEKRPCTTTKPPCNTTPPCTTTKPPCTKNVIVEPLQCLSSHKDCASLPNGTILLDCSHCRRYYVCTNQRTKSKRCRPGYWFDRDTHTCRPRGLVTNCIVGCN